MCYKHSLLFDIKLITKKLLLLWETKPRAHLLTLCPSRTKPNQILPWNILLPLRCFCLSTSAVTFWWCSSRTTNQPADLDHGPLHTFPMSHKVIKHVLNCKSVLPRQGRGAPKTSAQPPAWGDAVAAAPAAPAVLAAPRRGWRGWSQGLAAAAWEHSGHRVRALAWCPPPTVSPATMPKVTSLTCHRPVLPKAIPRAQCRGSPAESQLSAAGEEHSIRQNNTQGDNDFPFTPHYA